MAWEVRGWAFLGEDVAEQADGKAPPAFYCPRRTRRFTKGKQSLVLKSMPSIARFQGVDGAIAGNCCQKIRWMSVMVGGAIADPAATSEPDLRC